MNNLKWSFLLLILSIVSCNSQNNKEESVERHKELIAEKLAHNRIEVLDFYGTHRCVTCRNIEANTKKALLKYYPKELEAGIISFRAINVDDDKNFALAKNFEATGTALFLNVIKDDAETHVDLTQQAFSKGNDSTEMADELKFYIDLQLKDLKKEVY